MKREKFTGAKTLSALAAVILLGISSQALAQDAPGAQGAGSRGGHGMMGQNGHAMMEQGTMCPGQTPCQMKNALVPSHRQLHAVQETGNTDRDFAAVMIPHHQGAIDLAKAELANGKDPEMRRMAQKIISNNQKEIDQLSKWLSKPGGGAAASSSSPEDKRHLHPRDAK